MIGNRQTHAALPERIPGNSTGEFALHNRLDRQLDAVDARDRYRTCEALRAQSFQCSDAHAVVSGPDPFDFIAKAGQPGHRNLMGFIRVPVRDLKIEQLDIRVLRQCCVKSGFTLDSRNVGKYPA